MKNYFHCFLNYASFLFQIIFGHILKANFSESSMEFTDNDLKFFFCKIHSALINKNSHRKSFRKYFQFHLRLKRMMMK